MNEHDLKLYRGMIAERDREIALLRAAVTRYCDKSRMGTIEPMDVQQAVDRGGQRHGLRKTWRCTALRRFPATQGFAATNLCRTAERLAMRPIVARHASRTTPR